MDATWTRNAFYRWLYKRDNIPDDIFDKMELVNIKEIKIPRAKIIVNITIHYSLKFKLSASNTKSGKAEEFLFKADTPVHQSWTKVFAQSINDNVAKFMNENGEKTEDVLKSILNERNFRTLEETFEYFKDDLQKYCKPDTIAYLREEAYKEFPALKEWSYESSSIDFINFVPRVEQTYLELGYVDYTYDGKKYIWTGNVDGPLSFTRTPYATSAGEPNPRENTSLALACFLGIPIVTYFISDSILWTIGGIVIGVVLGLRYTPNYLTIADRKVKLAQNIQKNHHDLCPLFDLIPDANNSTDDITSKVDKTKKLKDEYLQKKDDFINKYVAQGFKEIDSQIGSYVVVSNGQQAFCLKIDTVNEQVVEEEARGY